MDPATVQLVIFIEQMVALAARSIADLSNVIQGSSAASVDTILADADATYQKIIANAKGSMTPPPVPPTPGPIAVLPAIPPKP